MGEIHSSDRVRVTYLGQCHSLRNAEIMFLRLFSRIPLRNVLTVLFTTQQTLPGTGISPV